MLRYREIIHLGAEGDPIYPFFASWGVFFNQANADSNHEYCIGRRHESQNVLSQASDLTDEDVERREMSI